MVGFGNDNGLTYFISGNIGNNSFNKKITLTGVMLAGKRQNGMSRSGGEPVMDCAIEKTDKIRLSYLDNTFTLLFSTMDYRDEENVYYQYRFTNEKKGVWHSTDAGMSEITFTQLPYGNHHLQVRACDNGGYSEIKELTVCILPPWYASWWAYLLYILIIGGVLYLLWNNYNHKRKFDENEAKIRLFVDFSHELRSPLTLIKNPLNSLMKKGFDRDTQRALDNMRRNTDRLLLMVNQILSIRKIEKGHMRLHYAETDLVKFTNSQCENFEYQAEQNKVSLSFIEPDEPMKVWIDREQFDKIISNLISNALKYVKSGGEIRITLSKVYTSGKERIILKVADTGPGIDVDQINSIFDRFYQTTTRPITGQLGFGIGLNLTQKLVAMHGGTIEAHNRKDCQGAEYEITLPVGKDHLSEEDLVDGDYFNSEEILKDEAVADNAKAVAVQESTRKKTSYKVVVVDDDDEILDFLSAELGSLYYVSTFKDGSEALSHIIDNVPDIVISDIKMPVMDGLTLLRRVKSNTRTSHVPVILLTTEVESSSKVEGFEHGADAYVDKPFDMEELKARVAALIANRIRMKGKYSGSQEQQGVLQQIEVKGNDEKLMTRIMKIMNERLADEGFNVEALADEIGISRVQLHRKMKEMTGLTAGDFIRNFRLQQAAKLLETGDVNISQVTYSVGLSNPTHFSIAFKKYFGVSPKEYMQSHSKKGSSGD